MLPTIVLVGRPNVGKSTLFNRLTQTRAALVADFPGLTRDRHYGRGRGGDRPYLVVDTGGFEPKAKTGIYHAMAKQTRQAIAESDVVIFLVDAREGLAAQDRTIADLLRRSGRPVLLAVNKAKALRRSAPLRTSTNWVSARRCRSHPRTATMSATSSSSRWWRVRRRRLPSRKTPVNAGHRRVKVADRRTPERRQIDADQYAARRRARDRVRRAGHDARLAVSRLRPRRRGITR